MSVSICDKKCHTYKRYWCELCKEYHSQEHPLYKEHSEYVLNRYWCKECKHTHIATRGDVFLTHLENKGCKIKYFAIACQVKCYYKEVFDKKIPEDKAEELGKAWSDIRLYNNFSPYWFSPLNNDFEREYRKKNKEKAMKNIKEVEKSLGIKSERTYEWV